MNPPTSPPRTHCTWPRTTSLVVGVLHVICATWAAQDRDLPFSTLTIDADPPTRPWYKLAGDINGDGQLDIVVAGAKGPLVAYLAPQWKKTQLADGGWEGVNGEIADLDGDGDADIVMGGIVWFENPGKVVETWKRHQIDNQKAHDIELADLDGDRRLDVVARDQSAFGGTGNAIFLYYQQAGGGWRKHIFPCPHGEGLKVGDADGDGDPDIVIGGRWFENPGAVDARWTERGYTSAWTEPDAKVELADINGDGRRDVVLTPAELKGQFYRVCWYEAPADRRSADWTEHVIVDSIECVIHALGVGDFDGDGAVDIAFAEMHQGQNPDEVGIFLNRNQGSSWRKQVLSVSGSHDIVVTDIDGDGDPDIIGANHDQPHPLQWWRNDRILK
jgi:hypothetical protein